MSDAEEYSSMEVSSDGVSVLKRFAEDEFPVPAIAFDFTSDRDETVDMRLTDTVPDSIDVEDLGFHPDYGSEYWSIEDNHIVFERELEGGSTYTTVYGVRAAGEEVEKFLTEPNIEEVDPPLGSGSGSAGGVDGEIDLEEGDADGGSSSTSADDSGDEDVPTLELNEPAEEASNGGGATASSDSGGGSSTETTETPASPSTGGAGGAVAVGEGELVSALATEIREGNVADEDIEALRSAIGSSDNGNSGGNGSIDARLDQMQNDVNNLRAYTNALEEFLDENGKGEEMIEDFSERLASFEDQIETLESEVVVGLQRGFDDLEEEFGEFQSEVEEELGVVDEIDEFADEAEERLEELAERIDGAAGRTAELSRRFDEFEEENDELTEQIDELEARTEELSEEISEAGDLSEVTDEIDEVAGKAEDLDDSVGDIQDDIEDLYEWKEQIQQTFGG